MIQRKTFRFGARPASASDTEIPLSPQDSENLRAYVTKLGETIDLLKHEISAIKDGELDVVGTLFEEKSRLLKWLELQTPVVQPFLTGNMARKLDIKGHLHDLKRHIEEDGAMLSRMSIAARTILREYQKISDRNSLGGTYGKSGEKRNGTSDPRMNIDQVL